MNNLNPQNRVRSGAGGVSWQPFLWHMEEIPYKTGTQWDPFCLGRLKMLDENILTKYDTTVNLQKFPDKEIFFFWIAMILAIITKVTQNNTAMYSEGLYKTKQQFGCKIWK